MSESGKLAEFGSLALAVAKQKYLQENETWEQLAARVSFNVFNAVGAADSHERSIIEQAIIERKFLPGGRYLYAAGREWHQTNNCALFRADDSSTGWAELLSNITSALMSGAGVGVDYSALRAEGSPLLRKGGESSGPMALIHAVNEVGRYIKQGGSRRSAIWAGLSWSHPDIFKFINAKNWPADIVAMKSKNYDAHAPLDGTNISVILDAQFFECYENPDQMLYEHARKVYDLVCRQMVTTAEPGFSVDYENSRESLRNACTEVVSEDDSDICNLGSLNLARIESRQEMMELTVAATAFLLAGSVYSDVPTEGIRKVRDRNRRLGLGLMGMHEWLLKRGKSYGPDNELGDWLGIYKEFSELSANTFSFAYEVNQPIKVRAIAPTGSLAILAETTSGIEPLFCVAYKRRYRKDSNWVYQNVVDGCAANLVRNGIDPDTIEDCYTLARDPERRVAFQAWVQSYVDQGISSTLNLAAWGSADNNEETLAKFGLMLYRHLPKIRGITCYPDGCRGGQPLTPISYQDAISTQGVEFVEDYVDICDLTKGESCGS